MDDLNTPETVNAPTGNSVPKMYIYPTGRRELIFAAFLLLFSALTCYGFLHGGLNLGYALGFTGMAASSLVYLGKRIRLSAYGLLHLVGVFVLAGLFPYSNDSGVEIVAFLMLLYAWQQTLFILTDTGSYPSGSLTSALDACKALCLLPFQDFAPNLRGLSYGKDKGGLVRRKTGSVFLGLGLSIPLVIMVIPLLMKADAAFEGLMDKLFSDELPLILVSLVLGILLALPRFSRAVTLQRSEKAEKQEAAYKGFFATSTINTALAVVSLIFLMYLFSQLAYFFNGFAGILPEGYTTAEYARRGFFEMCRLCAVNLGILALAAVLVKKDEGKLTLPTRLLSLFICLFSLVLVATSASKMALYIGTYGLTPKRIYTSVFMVFLGVAILCVGVWLIKPKFPYMKVIVSAAMILVIVTGYADVGTVVARYNVEAYQSGKLETIDVENIYDAGTGGTPYLAMLLEDDDPEVAKEAKKYLSRLVSDDPDFYFHVYTQNENGNYTIESQPFWDWSYKTQQEIDALEKVISQLENKIP